MGRIKSSATSDAGNRACESLARSGGLLSAAGATCRLRRGYDGLRKIAFPLKLADKIVCIT